MKKNSKNNRITRKRKSEEISRTPNSYLHKSPKNYRPRKIRATNPIPLTPKTNTTRKRNNNRTKNASNTRKKTPENEIVSHLTNLYLNPVRKQRYNEKGAANVVSEVPNEPGSRHPIVLERLNSKSTYKKVYAPRGNSTRKQKPTNVIRAFRQPKPELGNRTLLLALNLVTPNNNYNTNNIKRINRRTKQLKNELNLQKRLSELVPSRSPMVNDDFVETNNMGSLSYYVEKMKTFKDISRKNANDPEYLEHLFDAFLDCVEQVFLETGYINIDMKEENLVIDDRLDPKLPEVLLIDTDPKFFKQIVDVDGGEKMELMVQGSIYGAGTSLNDYTVSVKLSMLMMVLFIRSRYIDGDVEKRRIFRLNPSNIVLTDKACTMKLDYFRTFCETHKVSKTKDFYDRLTSVNKKIKSLTPIFDLDYMVYHYCYRASKKDEYDPIKFNYLKLLSELAYGIIQVNTGSR